MNQEQELIAAHDPSWRRRFAEEKERLQAMAPEAIKDLHHVGSTAVRGLAAAPVIDILMVLTRPLDEEEIQALAALGYEFRGEADLPGRQFFTKTSPQGFTIHALLEDHTATKAMVNFRNHLLGNPDQKTEFEAAKRQLIEQHGSDPDAHAREKDALLLRYDRKAAIWAHEQWSKKMAEGGEEEEDD